MLVIALPFQDIENVTQQWLLSSTLSHGWSMYQFRFSPGHLFRLVTWW